MKTPLIVLALVLTTAASFAQGKITIGNDSAHLIVWGGRPISQATGWNNLTMQLWGGTTAGSLVLQTTFVGTAIGNPAFDDGRINNTLFALMGVPGGATAFLQLRFLFDYGWDILLAGQSPVFTVTAGTFAPNLIVLGPPGGTSTWAPGNVHVGPIPEPRRALAGLAAVSVLIIRRRWQSIDSCRKAPDQ